MQILFASVSYHARSCGFEVELINRRSIGLEGCVKNIIETANAYKLDTKQYLPSYLHLTHNRLFSSDSNLYELVIYDFLKKEYQRQLHL